jgi:hypothetical protein
MTEEQRNKPFTMIEIFSKAISDCFDEEIILLNKDVEDDAIFSGIKNLISAECVEFREDTGEDYIMASGGQNSCDGDDHILIGIGHNHSHHRHNDSAIIELMMEQNDNGDDERSDFLMSRNKRICQDIPNLIVFKTKKRRYQPYSEENQSQDRILRMELSNSYFYTGNMKSQHQVEPVATKKNPLNLSRWKRRGKRRLLTIRKTRTL